MQKQNGHGSGDGGSDNAAAVTLESMRAQRDKISALLKRWPKTDQEMLELMELVEKGLLVWQAWITLCITEKEKEAERCKS